MSDPLPTREECENSLEIWKLDQQIFHPTRGGMSEPVSVSERLCRSGQLLDHSRAFLNRLNAAYLELLSRLAEKDGELLRMTAERNQYQNLADLLQSRLHAMGVEESES